MAAFCVARAAIRCCEVQLGIKFLARNPPSLPNVFSLGRSRLMSSEVGTIALKVQTVTGESGSAAREGKIESQDNTHNGDENNANDSKYQAQYGYVRNRSPQTQTMLDEMLRVDHAGEVGAVQIYAGQMWVLRGTSVQSTLKKMKEGEEVHLSTVKRLMVERRVRPTILLPLWEAAGFALGAATALLGREGAMACTVAVEKSISEHYNDQIRTLIAKGSKDKELLAILAKHRDEELEHHATALSQGAERAPFYNALSTVIQAGCAAAIQVAKRV